MRLFEAHVNAYAAAHPGPLEILDAGCGRGWRLNLSDVDYRLTGIDLDAESLQARVEINKDLDVAVVGDLRTVEIPTEAYDVVHSAFTLEHVHGAEAVLEKMANAVKPGGLLLLQIPDPNTVYAFLARVTPHKAHVYYRRYVEGRKWAGRPGYEPFPVVYDPIVGGDALEAWLAGKGLIVAGAGAWNSYLGMTSWARYVDLSFRAIALASAGRLTARHNNLNYVIAKPG